MEPRSPALQEDSLPAEPQGKPKNTGVGSLSLLQQISLTHELNRGLLQILYQLNYRGSSTHYTASMDGSIKELKCTSSCQTQKGTGLALDLVCPWLSSHQGSPPTLSVAASSLSSSLYSLSAPMKQRSLAKHTTSNCTSSP